MAFVEVSTITVCQVKTVISVLLFAGVVVLEKASAEPRLEFRLTRGHPH